MFEEIDINEKEGEIIFEVAGKKYSVTLDDDLEPFLTEIET